MLCKAGSPYKGNINYFNIKPFTTSSFGSLLSHLIQVDSGQTTINLIVLHLNTLLQ